MNPWTLALRTLLLARPRTVLAVLLIGMSLCVLDLFAGHIASTKARLEYQAVIGERLGHLSVQPFRGAEAGRGGALLFAPDEAQRVRRIIEASEGVTLVVPQLSVSGIAATGQRSMLFHGDGIGAALPAGQSGKLNPAVNNGVAVSSAQAQALGLRNGSSLTLHGAAPDVPSIALQAEVVDIFGSDSDAARALLMPLELAQALRNTGRSERMAVFLNEPGQLEQQRQALLDALHGDNLQVEVRSWQERSASYQAARARTDRAFDGVAGMVFAVIAAVLAATMSMEVLERRRELGTLRALGMGSGALFQMLVAEALWMAAIGIMLSLLGSGLIAWVTNRAALSATVQHPLNRVPMLVEMDVNRMLIGVVAVLAVALLASLLPAFRAARSNIADSLVT
jgi:putative ABC transport system permease protein